MDGFWLSLAQSRIYSLDANKKPQIFSLGRWWWCMALVMLKWWKWHFILRLSNTVWPSLNQFIAINFWSAVKHTWTTKQSWWGWKSQLSCCWWWWWWQSRKCHQICRLRWHSAGIAVNIQMCVTSSKHKYEMEIWDARQFWMSKYSNTISSSIHFLVCVASQYKRNH